MPKRNGDSMSKFDKGGTLSLLWLATYAITASAQTISGDIVVAVIDQSNLPVARATLDLVQTDTNVHQSAQTDESGLYLFSQLKPGEYRLEVSNPGFQKTRVDDIPIQVGQRPRVDV